MHIPEPATLRVTIAHDTPVVRAGLAAVLDDAGGFAVSVGPLADNDAPPDVAVADFDTGLRFLRARIQASVPRRWRDVPVLLFTDVRREQQVRMALASGVDGYLLQSSTEADLVEGVRAVARGTRHVGAEAARLLIDGIRQQSLTAREIDVLRLVSLGWPNKGIARELGIAACTVKSHVQAILAKLDVATRTEAARVGEARGFLSDNGGQPLRLGNPPADAGLARNRRLPAAQERLSHAVDPALAFARLS